MRRCEYEMLYSLRSSPSIWSVHSRVHTGRMGWRAEEARGSRSQRTWKGCEWVSECDVPTWEECGATGCHLEDSWISVHAQCHVGLTYEHRHGHWPCATLGDQNPGPTCPFYTPHPESPIQSIRFPRFFAVDSYPTCERDKILPGSTYPVWTQMFFQTIDPAPWCRRPSNRSLPFSCFCLRIGLWSPQYRGFESNLLVCHHILGGSC